MSVADEIDAELAKQNETWVKANPNLDKTIMSSVVSPNAPTTTNAQGGKQSLVEVRFDLVDGPAMFAMTHVLYQGAVKYGENNWRKIDIPDHLNHLIMHAYAYLAGDKTDEHLSHIMCRAMFAQGISSQGGPLK